MLASRTGRLVGVVFLLVILGGLCVGFGVQQSVVRDTSFPGTEDLAYDYDGHVGRIAYVGGQVIDTNPVVIEAEYDYYAAGEQHTGVLRLTIHDVPKPVKEGQILRTYAVVRPNNELVARNNLVIPQWHYWYMYAVSAVAGVWVLGRLIRGLGIDRTYLALLPRAENESPGGEP